MTSRRFDLSIVMLVNAGFVIAASRSTQTLGQKGGHQNLTLTLNETLEFRFSFTNAVSNSNNIVVHVMHQRPGADAFDRRCVIRQTRENCTSSAQMCRCLWEPFGSYLLHKIITKEDSGTWTFKLWNTQPEVIETLYISVEVENKTNLASGTMRDDAKSTSSTVIVVIIIIVTVATVAILSYLVIRFFVKTAQRDRMTTSASAPPLQASVPEAPHVSATESPEAPPKAPSVSATESPEPTQEAPPVSAAESPEPIPEAPPVSATESLDASPEAPPVSATESPEASPKAPSVSATESPEPTQEAPPVSEKESPDQALSLLLAGALASAPPSASAPVAPTPPAQPALAPASLASLETAPVPQQTPLAAKLTNKPLPPPKPSLR